MQPYRRIKSPAQILQHKFSDSPTIVILSLKHQWNHMETIVRDTLHLAFMNTQDCLQNLQNQLHKNNSLIKDFYETSFVETAIDSDLRISHF